jgi:hypothetical protein
MPAAAAVPELSVSDLLAANLKEFKQLAELLIYCCGDGTGLAVLEELLRAWQDVLSAAAAAAAASSSAALMPGMPTYFVSLDGSSSSSVGSAAVAAAAAARKQWASSIRQNALVASQYLEKLLDAVSEAWHASGAAAANLPHLEHQISLAESSRAVASVQSVQISLSS